MVIGRPKSDDSPQKYHYSYELYQLTQPKLPASANAADEIGTFLEWAITEKQDGFTVGDIISIGALAQGVGKSRNTAAKSVERLVAKGMVVRGKLKSPYQIVSQVPIFKDASLVADEQISLTIKMESESCFGQIRSLKPTHKQDELAVFLQEELTRSKDPLIQEAAGNNWRAGEIQFFQRLRTVNESGKAIGFLAEMTFLLLEPDQAAGLRNRVTRLHEQDVKQISMYPILEQCGLTDLRAGRTQISVARPPKFLQRELTGYVDQNTVDMRFFFTDEPMLKWTYALFRPDASPMASFSVCYVDSDLLSIFIRKLDVEL